MQVNAHPATKRPHETWRRFHVAQDFTAWHICLDASSCKYVATWLIFCTAAASQNWRNGGAKEAHGHHKSAPNITNDWFRMPIRCGLSRGLFEVRPTQGCRWNLGLLKSTEDIIHVQAYQWSESCPLHSWTKARPPLSPWTGLNIICTMWFVMLGNTGDIIEKRANIFAHFTITSPVFAQLRYLIVQM